MIPSVFITGTGRSGSNVLRAIWAKHPAVASLPFEHRFTVDPQGVLPFYSQLSSWSPYIADYRLKELLNFLYSLADRSINSTGEDNFKKVPYEEWELEQWIPGFKDLIRGLEDRLVAFKYKAAYPGAGVKHPHNVMYYCGPKNESIKSAFAWFLNECHKAICVMQEGSTYVDDNTWTSLFSAALVDILPSAKILVIVRDPRDVIASMLQQRWTPNNLDAVVTYYLDLMNGWWRERDNLNSECYLELRLEDLVADPATQLEVMGNFIGLRPTSEMLQHDLSKSNAGRFKEDLTKQQLEALETRIEHIIQTYNYTL